MAITKYTKLQEDPAFSGNVIKKCYVYIAEACAHLGKNSDNVSCKEFQSYLSYKLQSLGSRVDGMSPDDVAKRDGDRVYKEPKDSRYNRVYRTSGTGYSQGESEGGFY